MAVIRGKQNFTWLNLSYNCSFMALEEDVLNAPCEKSHVKKSHVKKSHAKQRAKKTSHERVARTKTKTQ